MTNEPIVIWFQAGSEVMLKIRKPSELKIAFSIVEEADVHTNATYIPSIKSWCIQHGVSSASFYPGIKHLQELGIIYRKYNIFYVNPTMWLSSTVELADVYQKTGEYPIEILRPEGAPW